MSIIYHFIVNIDDGVARFHFTGIGGKTALMTTSSFSAFILASQVLLDSISQ